MSCDNTTTPAPCIASPLDIVERYLLRGLTHCVSHRISLSRSLCSISCTGRSEALARQMMEKLRIAEEDDEFEKAFKNVMQVSVFSSFFFLLCGRCCLVSLRMCAH